MTPEESTELERLTRVMSATLTLEDEKAQRLYAAGEDFHLTELGNARRLVHLHGVDLRYCHPWRKWLVWDGTRWKEDNTGQVERLARDVPRSIYGEAERCEDVDRRKRLAAWALASESRQRIRAAIDLATSEGGVPILPDVLDQDPWALNARSGTIDVRTGELRPHRRGDYITKLCPIHYDAGAECPTFLRFLSEIMCGRQELVDYLRRAFGYGTTGSTREQVLFFLFGGGSNGKSTLLTPIRDTLGEDYNIESLPELLLSKIGDAHPTERAQLFGKRIVTTIEVEEGKRLAESMVKHLTGSDKVTARRMREDPWSFEPTHTIFIAANHKPEIRGTDYAIWRRIRLIPFEAVFEKGKNADETLPEKLAAEKPGILAWLVAGAMEWHLGGLQDPAEVLAATEGYRAEMDTLGDFIAEHCVDGDDAFTVSSRDLFDAYLRWHKDAIGGEALTQTAFGLKLRDRGYRNEKSKSGPNKNRMYWQGIGLRDKHGVEGRGL